MISSYLWIPTGAVVFGRFDRNPSLFGTLWIVVASLATLLLPGCSNSSSAHAVDMPRARDALKSALDEWKKGESLKSVRSSSSPMVVQDSDWAAGAKLTDYEIIGDGQAQDANLRVGVKLTVNGSPATGKSQGKTVEKKVWYLVTTSPQVTVFRDTMGR